MLNRRELGSIKILQCWPDIPKDVRPFYIVVLEGTANCSPCYFVSHDMKVMQEKKPLTLVLGATPNPNRYANIATHRLLRHDYPVALVGIKDGEIAGEAILKGEPDFDKPIDTITLYVGPKHQPAYYDYLLGLQPRRIIFNPGTENPELMQLCRENNIEPVVGCTLVMLSTGDY